MDRDVLKPEKDEEEYHFAENAASSGSVYGSNKADRGGIMEMFKRRNVLIALGLIIVVVAVYKMLGVFFATHKERTVISAPEVIQAVVPSKPVTVEPLAEATINQRITAVEAVNKNTAAKIDSVSSQLSGLQMNVDSLTATVNKLAATLQTYTDELQAQKKLLAEKKVKKPPVRIKSFTAKPTYYIKAMIPGRAWIVSERENKSITVSRGTSIPGYGFVEDIDIQRGTISTSSGVLLRYGPEDR